MRKVYPRKKGVDTGPVCTCGAAKSDYAIQCRPCDTLSRQCQRHAHLPDNAVKRDKRNRCGACAKERRRWRRRGGFQGPIDPSPGHVGECPLCHKEKLLCYDHCHKTGVFRAWLCGTCNRMLGMAYDDPQILRAAAIYLETNGASACIVPS
jgi:hypothetical protein